MKMAYSYGHAVYSRTTIGSYWLLAPPVLRRPPALAVKPAETPPLVKRAWLERTLVVFAGVVAGYVAGRVLEHDFGWPNAIMVTMPVGGLLTGITARFTLARFAPRPTRPDGDRPPRGRPARRRSGR